MFPINTPLDFGDMYKRFFLFHVTDITFAQWRYDHVTTSLHLSSHTLSSSPLVHVVMTRMVITIVM